jgi:hypothetical protein
LHEEFRGPRRRGRIAGCRAYNLPQGLRARLFRQVAPTAHGNLRRLVEPALMTQANHLLDEDRFLLVVEAY